MPTTMASCCSEPRRPRIDAGEISAMYAGAITEAAPTPRPPTTRQNVRLTGPSGEPGADGADDEQHRRRATITRMRP